jgi:hypothetical protein
MGKSEGKKLHGKPGCRWEGSIKMCVKGMGWGGMDWICLVCGSNKWQVVVNMAMNIWAP